MGNKDYSMVPQYLSRKNNIVDFLECSGIIKGSCIIKTDTFPVTGGFWKKRE